MAEVSRDRAAGEEKSQVEEKRMVNILSDGKPVMWAWEYENTAVSLKVVIPIDLNVLRKSGAKLPDRISAVCFRKYT